MKTRPFPRLLLALAAIAVALLLASLAFADGAGGGLAALAPAPSPAPVPHVAVSPEATAALWTAGLTFVSTLCGALAPFLAGSWPKLASLLHGLGVTLHMWRSARGALGGAVPMTLVYAGMDAKGLTPNPPQAAPPNPSAIGSAGLVPVILLVGLALGTARVLAACGPLSPGAAATVKVAGKLVCGEVGQSIEDVLCRKLAADPAECPSIAVDYVLTCDAVAAAVPMVPVSTPASVGAAPTRESALRAAIERLPGVTRKSFVDGGADGGSR